MKIKQKIILTSLVISLLISSFYVLIYPGKIKGDAIEYDGLAKSILQGKYELDGKQSMEREPGYPVFRASIKLFSQNDYTILFIQIILFCLTVYFVGLTLLEIDEKVGLWGFLGASLSYGLAFYASTHILEILTGFLLSIIGLLLIRGIKTPTTKYWVYLSILCSFLVLTRYPYIFVPIISIILMTKFSLDLKIEKRKIWKNIMISLVIMTSILSPWLIRNYINFGQINIAGRSGSGLYARAWKTDESWVSLRDSYLSVLVGRGILFTIYPNNKSIWLEQWGDWWRKPEVTKLWGETAVQRDNTAKNLALEIIFKDFNNFSKFAVWTGVDTLRFLQLQNPAPQAYGASFEGTFGPLAKENKIDSVKIIGLSIVHFIQFIYFIFLFISLYFGFKKYKYRFLPGLFIVGILLVHSVADNTARYGAPVQPWILASIFMIIIYPIFERSRLNRFNYFR